MILFGTKAAHAHSEKAEGLHCESCEQKDTLVFHIFSKHFHIFWIPILPYKKTGVSQCTHCKNQLDPKEMPEKVKRRYVEVKSKAKGPIWQFVGLLLLAILIVIITMNTLNNNKENAAYLENPKVDDVYEVKIDTKEYSTLKVVDVTDDSVFVVPNSYAVNKRRGVDDIDKNKNYIAEEVYGISRDDLKDMYEEGKVFDIKR